VLVLHLRLAARGTSPVPPLADLRQTGEESKSRTAPLRGESGHLGTLCSWINETALSACGGSKQGTRLAVLGRHPSASLRSAPPRGGAGRDKSGPLPLAARGTSPVRQRRTGEGQEAPSVSLRSTPPPQARGRRIVRGRPRGGQRR